MKPNGPAIKAFRESKELGTRELARRARISHQFMVRIQQGTRGASEETISRIADELGVPVAAISYPEPVASRK